MANPEKYLLISGGSRGIGRAITLNQAKPGAVLFVNYLRDEEAAAAVKTHADNKGAKLHRLQATVGAPDAIAPLVDAVRKTAPRLGAMIHNAALGVVKPVSKLRGKDWDLSLYVNANALLLLAQAA